MTLTSNVSYRNRSWVTIDQDLVITGLGEFFKETEHILDLDCHIAISGGVQLVPKLDSAETKCIRDALPFWALALLVKGNDLQTGHSLDL